VADTEGDTVAESPLSNTGIPFYLAIYRISGGSRVVTAVPCGPSSPTVLAMMVT
jgi:hypothetical protein